MRDLPAIFPVSHLNKRHTKYEPAASHHRHHHHHLRQTHDHLVISPFHPIHLCIITPSLGPLMRQGVRMPRCMCSLHCVTPKFGLIFRFLGAQAPASACFEIHTSENQNSPSSSSSPAHPYMHSGIKSRSTVPWLNKSMKIDKSMSKILTKL